MNDKRKMTRAVNRKIREEKQRVADTRASASHERLLKTLDTAKQLLGNKGFNALLQGQGIETRPRFLTEEMRQTTGAKDSSKLQTTHFKDISLDFAITWRFFFPLLSRPAIVTFLDINAPSFTLNLRDDFITLVTEGPFPGQFIGRTPRKPLGSSG